MKFTWIFIDVLSPDSPSFRPVLTEIIVIKVQTFWEITSHIGYKCYDARFSEMLFQVYNISIDAI